MSQQTHDVVSWDGIGRLLVESIEKRDYPVTQACVQDVRDMIYQPTLTSPRIYSWNDKPWSYLCCPTARQKCPKGYDWQKVGTAYNAPDRPVYAVVNAG